MSQWIKCSERMPPERVLVVTFGRHSRRSPPMVWPMQWNAQMKHWDAPGNYWSEHGPEWITHWQPLPGPPND